MAEQFLKHLTASRDGLRGVPTAQELINFVEFVGVVHLNRL
jgi:hypothetical protein